VRSNNWLQRTVNDVACMWPYRGHTTCIDTVPGCRHVLKIARRALRHARRGVLRRPGRHRAGGSLKLAELFQPLRSVRLRCGEDDGRRLKRKTASLSTAQTDPLFRTSDILLRVTRTSGDQPMRSVYIAMFLAISAYVSGVAMGADANVTTDEQTAVRSVLTAFVEAWNKHDAEAFSMVFADDADFTNVRGMSAHGRTEIAKFHAPTFATTFKDSHQRIVDTRVRFIKPDVAAVDAWWELTGAKTRDGQEIPLRKGLLNFVMTREKAHWLITVMHNMDLPVAP
jgi:uncharacterized protein (TIGR02246 family)